MKAHNQIILIVRFYDACGTTTQKQILGSAILYGTKSREQCGTLESQLHCAIVQASLLVQQVCICSHFAYWQNSGSWHFLLNIYGTDELIPTVALSPDSDTDSETD